MRKVILGRYTFLFILLCMICFFSGCSSADSSDEASISAPEVTADSPDEASIPVPEVTADSSDEASSSAPEVTADSDSQTTSSESGQSSSMPNNQENTFENPSIGSLESDDEKSAADEASRRAIVAQDSEQLIAAMRDHMQNELSKDDHGGMYSDQEPDATYRLHIWAKNSDSVKRAVSTFSYQQATSQSEIVIIHSTKCSLQDLDRLAKSIENIPANDGEIIVAKVREKENDVLINISESAEMRVSKEIESILQDQGISKDYIFVVPISDSTNPEINIDT